MDRQQLGASISGGRAWTPKGSNPPYGRSAGEQTEGSACHGLAGAKQVY